MGNVNKIDCSFLLDTGASYTVIDRRVWEAIPGLLLLRPIDTSLTVADCTPLMVYGCFQANMDITLTGERPFDVVVVAELG